MERDQEQSQQGELEDTTGNNQNQENQDPPIPPWQAALFETNARLRQEAEARARAELELNTLRQQNQQQQQNNRTPLDPNTLLNDPERFRQTLNADMASQVAPLNSFIEEQQRKDLYWQNKYNLAQRDNRIGQIMQQLGQQLDGYFISNPTVIPNEQNIRTHVAYLVGEYALAGGFNNQQQNNGQQQQRQPNQQQQNNQPNRQQNQFNDMIPPHIRPSGRPGANQQQDQEPDVTEQERFLAKKDGMTLKEYVKLRDAQPHEAQAVWSEIVKARKARNGGT